MNKFSDYINERGFPTDDTKRFFKERLCREIATCLRFANTESEVRVMSGILKTVVGDMVFERLEELKNEK
jgi:hypothetical protein